MQAYIRRKLSMAGKALAFERANPATGASHLKVVTDLEALVARVDTVFAQERLGTIAERAATARRKVVRNELALNLRHLVHVAERAAKREPALAGKFVAPDYQGPNRAIVAHAKAMLAEATRLQELLVPAGLGPTYLPDLAASIGEFENASLTLDAGRRDHILARADFADLAGECSEVVGILNVLNAKRFANDSELLAGWKAVRNIFGPFTRRDEAPETPMGLLPPGV
jgi:hypothetical protein